MTKIRFLCISSFLVVFTFCFSALSQIESHEFNKHTPICKPKPGELKVIELLGKNIFYDNIACPDNMSCATCHNPNVGFTGPKPSINKGGSVYPGAVKERFGNRKPPSSSYATFSPVFHFNTQDGQFAGGNFWDGRATGELLGNPAADQALGPFLNPVEQNNPGKLSVLLQIANSEYAGLWKMAFGTFLTYWTPWQIYENYNRVGLAIVAFEGSSDVSPFTSKYDYYIQGKVDLDSQETAGLELFNGKGKCALCHTSTVGPYSDKPLFTDFTFDNLGVPKNPDNPFYHMDTVLIDGSPINPDGEDWIDYGLGGYLATTSQWASYADENIGKFKVPTLRNVDKRPGTNFPKAYMHNGVFKSLNEVVRFYNTRDVESWPPPEVSQNMNVTEVGNLGLTEEEINEIVIFLETLSDGYIPVK